MKILMLMLILCSQEVGLSSRSCILSKILDCTTKTEDVDDNSDIIFPGSESLLRFFTVFVLYSTKHAKTSKSVSKTSVPVQTISLYFGHSFVQLI